MIAIDLLPDDAVDLNRQEAAEWLSERGWVISKKTLEQMAWKRTGPAYSKWGRQVVYAAVDLRLWAEARIARYEGAV